MDKIATKTAKEVRRKAEKVPPFETENHATGRPGKGESEGRLDEENLRQKATKEAFSEKPRKEFPQFEKLVEHFDNFVQQTDGVQFRDRPQGASDSQQLLDFRNQEFPEERKREPARVVPLRDPMREQDSGEGNLRVDFAGNVLPRLLAAYFFGMQRHFVFEI